VVEHSYHAWPALVRWVLFCHLATLVRNARLHGRAENIRIEIGQTGETAVMLVEDDGLGLENTSGEVPAGTVGLRSVQRDVEEEGGTLTLSRSPAGGLRITERLPLRRTEALRQ
jgi:signal transduction histidine kinase